MDTKANEKNTLYVVSDIHSCRDALMRALDDAGFFADESGKLLLLGDALDRGDDPLGVIDLLLDLQDKGRLIYVKGNHEELFLNCLQTMTSSATKNSTALFSHHYKNGTVDTLLAIAGMTEDEAFAYPTELARRVMDSPYYKRLLPAAIDYYETDEFVFCHGWVPCFTVEGEYGKEYIYNPNWREASPTDWWRARWYNGMELACLHDMKVPGKTVVCGHVRSVWGHANINGTCNEWDKNVDRTPFFADGVIGIDGTCFVSGIVNCLIIGEE